MIQMPFVGLQTSVKLDEAKKTLLQETISELITLIPGKKAENTMISLIDGISLHMGTGKADCLYINVRLLGEAPQEAKGQFVAGASEALSKQLGVDISCIYINFDEYKSWGSRGTYRTV
jgi:phenylpyruvate tautomerase PptA (4-oxalocrotonate tautomerase family)